MITDLTKDGNPSGRNDSGIPKTKSGGLPRTSFLNEYKDKRDKGRMSTQMSDVASSVKILTKEIRETRDEMKRSTGGVGGKFKKAEKFGLDSRSSAVLGGGAREMSSSAKLMAASSKEIAKQTSMFARSIDKFGSLSKNSMEKMARSANKMATATAMSTRKGAGAVGRGAEKAASFATNTQVSRKFEQDVNDAKEAGREQLMTMLFMGNPALSYMGQGAIKGLSPAIKKAWQLAKRKSGNRKGGQGALMRHQGGMIFAHEGNVIRDPKGQKRPLKKDEHMTVLKEGEMVLPTHEKNFMQKFSKTISEGVVEAQGKYDRIKAKTSHITSTTPAMDLPQKHYFQEMQNVLEESQKLMTLNTYGGNGKTSGLKSAFAHAVVPFAGKYKSELPNANRMGVLGAQLSTLSKMYTTSRAQDSEQLQQTYQQSLIIKEGLGVQGRVKKPKSTSFSETVVKAIKGNTIGRAKLRSQKFGEDLGFDSKRLRGSELSKQSDSRSKSDEKFAKAIDSLVKITYIAGVKGERIPAPTVNMSYPQMLKNAVRVAKINKAEKQQGYGLSRRDKLLDYLDDSHPLAKMKGLAEKVKMPQGNGPLFGMRQSMMGRGMMVGDSISGGFGGLKNRGITFGQNIGQRIKNSKDYENFQNAKAVMMGDIQNVKSSIGSTISGSIQKGKSLLTPPPWAKALMKDQIEPYAKVGKAIGKKVGDWNAGRGDRKSAKESKQLTFWTRRYKSQLEMWANGDAKTGLTEGIPKLRSLARSLIPLDDPDNDTRIKDLLKQFMHVYMTAKKTTESKFKPGTVSRSGSLDVLQDRHTNSYSQWKDQTTMDWRENAQAWGQKHRSARSQLFKNNPKLGKFKNKKYNENLKQHMIKSSKYDLGEQPERPDTSMESYQKSLTEKRRAMVEEAKAKKVATKGASNAKKSVEVDGKSISDPEAVGSTTEELIYRQAALTKENVKQNTESKDELKKQTGLLETQVKDIMGDETDEANAKKKGIWNKMFGRGGDKEKDGSAKKKGGGIMGLLGSPWGKVLGMLGAGLAIPTLGAVFGGKSMGRMGKFALIGASLGGILGFITMGPGGAALGVAAGAAMGGMLANSEMGTIDWVADQVGVLWRNKEVIGKGAIVGGALGFFMGGPAGAMAGAALGGWGLANLAEKKAQIDAGVIDSKTLNFLVPDLDLLNQSWKGALIGGAMGFMAGGPAGGVAGAAIGSWASMKMNEIVNDNPEGAAAKVWKTLGLGEHSKSSTAGAVVGSVIGFMYGGPVGMVAGGAAGALIGASISRIIGMKQEAEAEQERQKKANDKLRVQDQGMTSVSSSLALSIKQSQGSNLGKMKLSEMRKKLKEARHAGDEWIGIDTDKALAMKDAAIAKLNSDPNFQAMASAESTLKSEIKAAQSSPMPKGEEARSRRKELLAMGDENSNAFRLGVRGRYEENAGRIAAGQLKPGELSDNKILSAARKRLTDIEVQLKSYNDPRHFEEFWTQDSYGNATKEKHLKASAQQAKNRFLAERDSIRNDILNIQQRTAKKKAAEAAKALPAGGLLQSSWGTKHGVPSDKSIQKHMGGPVQGAMTTSGFGNRLDPLTGKPAFHDGIDMVGSSKKITATSGGIILRVGKEKDRGDYVEVMQENGKIASYDHLASISVRQGDWVNPGENIGQMGSTGRSTGIHLHYKEEMIKGGKRIPVMPMGGKLDTSIDVGAWKEWGSGIRENASKAPAQAAIKAATWSAKDILSKGIDKSSELIDQYGNKVKRGNGSIFKIVSLFQDLFSKIFGGVGSFLSDQFREPENYGSVADKWKNQKLSSGYDAMFSGGKFGGSGKPWRNAVKNMVKIHESGSINKPNLKVYRDTMGYDTIGFGHKLKDGENFKTIDDATANKLFDGDFAHAIAGAVRVSGAKDLPEMVKTYGPYRSAALIDMSYNLGAGQMGQTGLGGFIKMWDNLKEKDYIGAGAEILDSKYRNQVGGRALTTAQLMATGPEKSSGKDSALNIINMLNTKKDALTGGGNARSVISEQYHKAMGSGITKSMIDKWSSIKSKASSMMKGTHWPPTTGYRSSPFGTREGRNHNGTDIASWAGTPVAAALKGTVARVEGNKTAAGNFVVVDHGHGLFSKYMHLQDGVPVTVGDSVSAGDIIGHVGGTGNGNQNEYGNHLHFEIGSNKRKNTVNSAIDPEYFFAPVGGDSGNFINSGSLGNKVAIRKSSPPKEQLAQSASPGKTVMDPLAAGPDGRESMHNPIDNNRLVNLQVNRDSGLQSILGSEFGKKTSELGRTLEKFANATVFNGGNTTIVRGGDTSSSSRVGGGAGGGLQNQVEAVMDAILNGRGYIHS